MMLFPTKVDFDLIKPREWVKKIPTPKRISLDLMANAFLCFRKHEYYPEPISSLRNNPANSVITEPITASSPIESQPAEF